MSSKYQITCECGYRMQVGKEYFGRTGKCPKCHRPVKVMAAAVDTIAPGPLPGQGRPARPATTPGGPDSGPVDWNTGDVVLNLYEVKDLLGEGGMGKVFKVFHRTWKIELAVKCPKPHVLEEAGGFENFEQECETWVNLGLHPHTVSCYYVRQIGGIPRIFAEYVGGGSLWNWVEKGLIYKAGPEKALERVLAIAIQSAWGLHHAHEMGLIHRDVKTANVMMTPEGTAKVTDFGLAKVLAKRSSTSTPVPEAQNPEQPVTVSIGGMTPAYCSPEQRRGLKLTRATDIWSWALCVLEMLAGRVFWRMGIEAPQALQYMMTEAQSAARVPNIPSGLTNLLGRCFNMDPQGRPETMLEAAEALQRVYQQSFGRPYARKAPKSVEGRGESYNNRAVSFMDLGKESEAQRCWEDALKVAPQHPESTFNSELIRWRAAQTTDDAFLYRMRDVSVLHPGDPLPVYLMAQAHLERGDWESAIIQLEEIKGVEEYAADVAGLLQVARERYRSSRRLLRTMKGHADSVNCVRWHPNSRQAFSSSEDNTVRLWDLQSGQTVRQFEGHNGSVPSFDVTPDGLKLLTGSRDRTIRVWDVETGECLETYTGHTGAVMAMACSGDGARAVSGGADFQTHVWRLDVGRSTRSLKGHTDAITCVDINHIGTHCVTASLDGTARVWEAGTGRMLRMIAAHAGGVFCVWLSPDAEHLVTGGVDMQVKLWNPIEGRCLATFEGHRDRVESVAMTPDKRFVVSASKDNTIRVWEAATGRCVRTFEGHTDRVSSVDINKEGTMILSGSQDGTIRIWSMGSSGTVYAAPLMLCRALESEKAVTTEAAFNDALDAARKAFDEDPRKAAAWVRKARSLPGYARKGEAMKEWFRLYLKLPKRSLDSAWEGFTFQGHKGPIKSAKLTYDGQYLVSASNDHTLKVWETATGKCLRTMESMGTAINSATLTEDGLLALTTSDDGTLSLWDLKEGKHRLTFEGFGVSIEAACLSSSGRFAVSVGWEINLWNTETGVSVRTFERHAAGGVSVFLSRDTQLMLVGGSEGALDLWDVVAGARVRTFKGHTGTVRCVQLSVDGRLALSVSSNPWDQAGELKLWDIETAKLVQSFIGHTSAINSAHLSEDNRFVLSGSKDNTVVLWDVATGKAIRAFKGHRDSVEAVCLARDGRFAISASADGTMKSWILDWDLENREETVWDKEAQLYLNSFVLQHTDFAAELPRDREPSEKELAKALTRRGRAEWTDEDFDRLMYMLGCAGYGWIGADSVHDRLERTARKASSISFVPRKGWFTSS